MARSTVKLGKKTEREIVLLFFDGVQTLDVAGPLEVFAIANAQSTLKKKPYKISLASSHGGDLTTHAGIKLSGTKALNKLPANIDTLIIAGGSEHALRSAYKEKKVLPWIIKRAKSTRRVVSICTGAFVLAASGLLDGRKATTHWNSCETLRMLFPQVKVEQDAIFTVDGAFYTSAGITAGIDLCLALVEEDLGSSAALAVARELVLYMRRSGGQSQFSSGLRAQFNASTPIQKLTAEIIENPTKKMDIQSLAEKVGMAERTFSRCFRKETGYTPAHFVDLARVERAKSLLESSHAPLKQIAHQCGFGSLDSFHRSFLKYIGITPGFYRDRFTTA